ncbi:hypothetical protein [Azospirillum sp. B506]|uniref:ABC transporter permease subunit n=1 Tax=Azospirillum sp. B506 TaxID=137721 RepID=UPI00034CB707|nr:hypothetical protein [Azospirillum sp. B506]
MFLSNYRGWVVVASLIVCISTWIAVERTKLGIYPRVATENPVLVQAFGINVPRMITLIHAFGVVRTRSRFCHAARWSASLTFFTSRRCIMRCWASS